MKIRRTILFALAAWLLCCCGSFAQTPAALDVKITGLKPEQCAAIVTPEGWTPDTKDTDNKPMSACDYLEWRTAERLLELLKAVESNLEAEKAAKAQKLKTASEVKIKKPGPKPKP